MKCINKEICISSANLNAYNYQIFDKTTSLDQLVIEIIF